MRGNGKTELGTNCDKLLSERRGAERTGPGVVRQVEAGWAPHVPAGAGDKDRGSQEGGMAGRPRTSAPHLHPAGGRRPTARPSSAGSSFLAGTAHPVRPAGAQKPQSWGRPEPPGPESTGRAAAGAAASSPGARLLFSGEEVRWGRSAEGQKGREGEPASRAPRSPWGAGRGPHLGENAIRG